MSIHTGKKIIDPAQLHELFFITSTQVFQQNPDGDDGQGWTAIWASIGCSKLQLSDTQAVILIPLHLLQENPRQFRLGMNFCVLKCLKNIGTSYGLRKVDGMYLRKVDRPRCSFWWWQQRCYLGKTCRHGHCLQSIPFLPLPHPPLLYWDIRQYTHPPTHIHFNFCSSIYCL